MLRPSLWLAAALAAIVFPRLASAHFLWLVGEPQERPEKVQVYFAEAAEPDDPALLDRVAGAKAWAIGGRRGEPLRLDLKRTGDSLQAELPAAARQSIVVLQHTYGVVSRGGETFLLNYYAKAYPSALPGAWRAAADPERLPLEITPSLEGDQAAFKVTWQGKPAQGASLVVEGPGASGLEGETDASGVYRCKLPEAGHYSIRARLVEDRPGEHDGKEYQAVRHYSTLALRHTPAQIAPTAHNLPELPHGVTSFGAAIAGEALYLYGGNYGSAHEYYDEGQSGDLWRLDLAGGEKWEKAATGPRLQGLAMVAHQDKLYRVGGFTAMNREGEEQDLRSQADFARFDPEKKGWEPLASLPAPRSSHDAALVGDTLYVVGGWALQGKSGESKWHDDALAVDLSADKPQWKTIAAPPFKRRALALAAWQGKLYCLGGMQEEGGPTTAVALYDPAKDSWSEGPALLGGSMDGFGAAAFACGEALYATTITGSIQRLRGEGKAWEHVGQLDYPRFFHRMLPTSDERLIVVGGGNMSFGKIQELEVVPVKAPAK